MSPLAEKLLERRGITGADARAAFLDPSVKRLVPPEDLPGVREALAVIVPAVTAGRKIVVFGDYDCDGVCASAILVTALRAFGADVHVFLPNRFTEGYGLTAASLARLLETHPDVALVVTVDNGITSACEIADLRARGVQVVVTDHHLPGAELPQADALVNPRVASCAGCDNLCGAGVAFFLVSALARAEGLPPPGEKYGSRALVLAGLATVVDIVPLTEQNRILAARSIAAFMRHAPKGLLELRQRVARNGNPVRSWDYAFLLGPRVNAAGRMDSAQLAYDLLVECDTERVRELAQRLDTQNVVRKTLVETFSDEVAGALEADGAAVVAHGAAGDARKLGVAGIVAARLMERAKRPVAVTVGAHGSARAPEGYNIHDALTAAADALDRFGGHAAAGGFSVKEGRFDDFKRLFTAACAAQRAANAAAIDAAARREPDAWIDPVDLTLDLYDEIRRFEPFGEGNPEPVFGLRAVAFKTADVMGQNGAHASFTFVNQSLPRAVWWNHGAQVESLRAHPVAHDILFTLILSDYGTPSPHLELSLVSVRS